ncbi:MAG: hypothetical protein NT169_09285 [Chloroflexi bacterium]|nr:hypothetical protein [Chloroflexota bacterium]
MTLLEKLVSNTSLALVVVGLLLFVIGAAGGWPNPLLKVTEPGWRIALACIGAFVGGAGVLSLLRNKSVGAQGTPSPKEIGIQIVSPSVGEQVARTFPVSGVYRHIPDGYQIWVFTTNKEGQIRKYWPQEDAMIQGHTWHSRVNYLGGLDDAKKILVFVVGKQGQALIHYFKTAGTENKNWPAIVQLTDDMLECASTTVLCTK